MHPPRVPLDTQLAALCSVSVTRPRRTGPREAGPARPAPPPALLLPRVHRSARHTQPSFEAHTSQPSDVREEHPQEWQQKSLSFSEQTYVDVIHEQRPLGARSQQGHVLHFSSAETSWVSSSTLRRP